jgi:predicted transcriptional regulator
MTTFTSSLPDDLLRQLEEISKSMKLPKNRLIEKALRIYLDQLNKAEYIKSYKQLADDTDILQIAEEGMEEYMSQLDTTDDEQN